MGGPHPPPLPEAQKLSAQAFPEGENQKIASQAEFLFLTLSNKDSSREAWENFMKAFICLKPGIRRHWRRQGFKGSLCCCVLSGPVSSTNLEHFIFKDVMNTGDVGWQPEKCYCLLNPPASIT